MPSLDECHAILQAHAHHETITPERLWHRLYQGMALHDALHLPIGQARRKRHRTFAEAVQAYLEREHKA